MSDTPRNDACKWTPITDLASLSQQLERELAEAREQHTIELAAISLATIQNTESSRKDRIDRSNSYCTQSYLDVCRAVDREIELSGQLTAHKAALEKCENVISLLNEDGGYLHTETSGLCYHCAGTGNNLASVVHNEGCPQTAVDEALQEIAKLKNPNEPLDSIPTHRLPNSGIR